METAWMLAALDRMCHADGMTLYQFNQVGIWMDAVGPEMDMSKLGDASKSKIKQFYKRFTLGKRKADHV